MKIINAGRKLVVYLIALGLALSVLPVATAASFVGAPQKTGGVRGDNGQTLRVTVKLDGKPLMNTTATVTVTASDGTVVVSGQTTPAGTYSASLDAGIYTVTATTTDKTATGSVTIVQSMSPAVLALNLQPKTSTP